MASDVGLRLLLGGILYRATLRAFAARVSAMGAPPVRAQEKMELHRIVEETAWALPAETAALVEGRDVDDGVGGLPALEALAARLADEAVSRRP